MAQFSATQSTYLDDDFDSLPIIIQPDHDEFDNPPNSTHSRNMSSTNMREPRVPTHPIPAFQAAFAESMLEASRAPTHPTQQNSKNATERRKVLLDQELHEETHASRWKPKPGQRFHELWKLMSQISFGVYLLLNGIAKDDEQVLNILQGHVDEVDSFLEQTLDDFDLAQQDIDERLKLLKVPLENIQVFDTMLEDRAFRLQIVNGNERIEHIITRTASAMNDALKDVEQGISATRQFIMYLSEEDEDNTWKEEQPEMIRVFDAMKGNANGWYRAFNLLQTKGQGLSASLVQLGSVVHEMSRRAGEVSRQRRFSTDHSSPVTSTPTSPQREPYRQHHSPESSFSSQSSIAPKIQETLPALRYAQKQEPISEPSPQREQSRPKIEPQIITLKPTTYTPVPSPSRTPVLREESPKKESLKKESPPPQTGKRNSLRNRFSLKRKPPGEIEHNDSNPAIITPTTLLTPPTSGRGPDSAYFSDTDKIYVSGGVTTPSYEKVNFPPSPQLPYATLTHRPSLPHLDSDSSYRSIGSPGSESRIHLRPVNANPNSPLQRPWTAAPDERRAPPSRMGMSTMSEMTSMSTLTSNDSSQKPLKKKKSSPFHWFKKAFSLSEEEKAAFEARRRAPDPVPEERIRPMFLDGKRIKDGNAVVYNRDGASTRASGRDGATTRASTRDGASRASSRPGTRQQYR